MKKINKERKNEVWQIISASCEYVPLLQLACFVKPLRKLECSRACNMKKYIYFVQKCSFVQNCEQILNNFVQNCVVAVQFAYYCFSLKQYKKNKLNQTNKQTNQQAV